MATNGATEDVSEVEDLKDQLRRLQLQHEETLATLMTRLEEAEKKTVHVQVQPPQPLPKLKTFTGLPPENNQETTYKEWRRQVLETTDDPAVTDPGTYIRRSLRGPALQQVATLGTNNPKRIIQHLDSLFGALKNPEDLYFELCQLKPRRDEGQADFLLILSAKLKEVQEAAQFPDDEYHRRLYLAFSKAMGNSLFALELRNKFGVPGETSPPFEQLFRFVRQLQDLDSSRPRKMATAEAGVHTVHPEAAAAAESGHQHGGRRFPKIFKGTCYNCGLEGHIYRQCKNPSNPSLVATQERERRRKNNEWRKLKGLPLLPLN